MPDRIINLGGKILAPGFLDIQINGAMGMDFSVFTDDESYAKGVKLVNKTLVKYGVTAYCPTLTSQHADVYKKVCPLEQHVNPGASAFTSAPHSESAGRIRNSGSPR
jgi:N-acetylglucosamine-6-phosphate deacetylase